MALADSGLEATIYFGESPATITLGGTVVKGDILGKSGTWQRALGTVAGVIHARCVAAESGVTGQQIEAYFGVTELGGRISGGTEGNAVYVAEGTDAGEYIDVLPTTTGDATKVIGYTVSATRIMIDPAMNDDSVKAA